MLPVTLRLYPMMWRLHRETRPKLLAAIEAYRGQKTVVHTRSPKQLAAFSRAHV